MIKSTDIRQGHTLYSMHEDWANASKEKGIPVSITKWFVASKNYQRNPPGQIDLNLNVKTARDMAAKGHNFFKSRRKAEAFMKNNILHFRTMVYFG